VKFDVFQGSSLMSRGFASITLAGVVAIPTVSTYVQASDATQKSVIVSPLHPVDSRGEVVYEYQGDDQKDFPIVAGILVQPTPIKTPQPSYPKSHKKDHAIADIKVEGVIAQNGDLIDPKPVDNGDPDFTRAALASVDRYKFKPATLDGKPIAILMRVVVSFRIY
jgi:Gram-negative bacterial TonB protein C-terminal